MATSAEEQEQQKQEDLIAAVAVLIVMGGLTPEALTPKIAALITAAGLVAVPAAILAVVSLALGSPVVKGPVSGKLTALSVVQGREDMYRAAYIVAATSRVSQSIRGGMTPKQAIDRETVNWKAHLDAQQRRANAAKKVDLARARYGAKLGWYAVMDSRTSAECKEANGHNFDALTPPSIGYPGSVHRFCRCTPGKPFVGAGTVNVATSSGKAA